MTQNEKDREWLNHVDEQYIQNGKVSEENFVLFEVMKMADRLLTEREEAETVYKYEGDTDCQYAKEEKQIDYRVNYGTGELSSIERGIKGVWIPDGEAE